MCQSVGSNSTWTPKLLDGWAPAQRLPKLANSSWGLPWVEFLALRELLRLCKFLTFRESPLREIASKTAQEAFQDSQGGPDRAPRLPQEGPKASPKGPQEDTKTPYKSSTRGSKIGF